MYVRSLNCIERVYPQDIKFRHRRPYVWTAVVEEEEKTRVKKGRDRSEAEEENDKKKMNKTSNLSIPRPFQKKIHERS